MGTRGEGPALVDTKKHSGSGLRILCAKATVEFLGTFLLCFTITCAAGQAAPLAAVAIGSTLMCAIFAGGHISGAHYNPAVTLAVYIRGKCTLQEALAFWPAQFVAGFAGGGVGLLALPSSYPSGGYPALGAGVSEGSAFLAELILTFALTHNILHVATSDKQANNSYYGLAIGWTVLSGAISVGSISGGCFNPAVAMLTVVNGEASSELWVHIVGPLLGGFISGVVFRATRPSETTPEAPGSGEASVLKEQREALATYVLELIGTTLLSFTVACAASPSISSPLAPLSIGAMLMTQVFMGGPVSGGHYNPAVSLGCLVRGATGFKPLTFAIYVVVQLVAGMLGGVLARGVLDAPIGYPAVAAGVEVGRAFVAELVATFFLVFVVLQSATNSKTGGNSFFGLAIGLTVAAMAISVGGISGGAFNPAVAMLGLVSDESLASSFWVYFVAPPLGGLLAGCTFRIVSFDEFTVDKDAHAISI